MLLLLLGIYYSVIVYTLYTILSSEMNVPVCFQFVLCPRQIEATALCHDLFSKGNRLNSQPFMKSGR